MDCSARRTSRKSKNDGSQKPPAGRSNAATETQALAITHRSISRSRALLLRLSDILPEMHAFEPNLPRGFIRLLQRRVQGVSHGGDTKHASSTRYNRLAHPFRRRVQHSYIRRARCLRQSANLFPNLKLPRVSARGYYHARACPRLPLQFLRL